MKFEKCRRRHCFKNDLEEEALENSTHLNSFKVSKKNEIASFLRVELVLSLYWSVSCDRNDLLARFSVCPAISNEFSAFMPKFFRSERSERVKKFWHEG